MINHHRPLKSIPVCDVCDGYIHTDVGHGAVNSWYKHRCGHLQCRWLRSGAQLHCITGFSGRFGGRREPGLIECCLVALHCRVIIIAKGLKCGGVVFCRWRRGSGSGGTACCGGWRLAFRWHILDSLDRCYQWESCCIITLSDTHRVWVTHI